MSAILPEIATIVTFADVVYAASASAIGFLGSSSWRNTLAAQSVMRPPVSKLRGLAGGGSEVLHPHLLAVPSKCSEIAGVAGEHQAAGFSKCDHQCVDC